MFKSILSFGKRPNQAITDALYGKIVAAARQRRFYSAWGVPDTPLGRFEMLSVHMFLFLERARGGTAAFADVAQELTDEFFKDVEHSLRELGIGDLSVPKRMKKLARMFYGRADAYRTAIEAQDHRALATALARNVRPDEADWPHADALAAYIAAATRQLSAQDEVGILAGRLAFPAAGEEMQEAAR